MLETWHSFIFHLHSLLSELSPLLEVLESAHLHADDSQMFASSPDFCPRLQTHKLQLPAWHLHWILNRYLKLCMWTLNSCPPHCQACSSHGLPHLSPPQLIQSCKPPSAPPSKQTQLPTSSPLPLRPWPRLPSSHLHPVTLAPHQIGTPQLVTMQCHLCSLTIKS